MTRIVIRLDKSVWDRWRKLAESWQIQFGIDDNKKNESGIHWSLFLRHVVRHYETGPMSFGSKTREKLFRVAAELGRDLDSVAFEALGMMESEYNID